MLKNHLNIPLAISVINLGSVTATLATSTHTAEIIFIEEIPTDFNLALLFLHIESGLIDSANLCPSNVTS